MISRFFIDRPIFATVVSIVITLAGGLAAFSLPIAQYPEVTPPTIQVLCRYPGANAKVIANTVAAPIEQQVNGVEDMLYMSSQSSNDGVYILLVTFELGTDIDEAMVAVQNRVSLAMPQLPDVVQTQGVNVTKKSPDILLVVNFTSPGGRYDDIYLSNYATINVRDELARIEGVGDTVFLGQRDYSMRVWLDPDQLAARDMTAAEVVREIRQQNVQIAAGQVGQEPTTGATSLQLTIDAAGRLATPEEFGDIVVKTVASDSTSEQATVVKLSDVARVELAASKYNMYCWLDDTPTVALAIHQRPGANALATAKAIKAKMKELEARFPENLNYEIVFDTTPFVRESIRDVFGALRDAVLLVALVVLLFLQNWRAAVIPLVAVPVAIVGTFAAMAAAGFTLNMLSLFGLVLAIGIVVDDAIVVVENVQRWLEQGYEPKEAARRAMDEVTGPIVAVAAVLVAVFVPCAFIGGITGEFFRQFALTIAVSTVISAFNSLTLSPALAAVLLKPKGHRRDPLTWLFDTLFGWLFRFFNRAFAASTHAYTSIVRRVVRISVVALLVYGGLLYATYFSFERAPKGFIPLQDKGWLLVNVELPDSASVERTEEVMRRVAEVAKKQPGVANTITVAGWSIVVNSTNSNYGTMFVILEPFEDRKSLDLNGLMIFLKLRKLYPELIQDAAVEAFPPPPVNGLGATGGFKLMVEDRNDLGFTELAKQTDKLVEAGTANKELAGVMTLFEAHSPQLHLDIDRPRVRSMGLTIDDVSETLQIYLGSAYVNNLTLFGRSWQVNAQAESDFRSRVEDIGQIKMRNIHQEMVPLAAVVDAQDTTGPAIIMRYNNFVAAPVNGRTQLGISSSRAIDIMDQAVADDLSHAMKAEWTDLTLLQIRAGDTVVYVFAFTVVFVFLVLAALYESWLLPLSILLVVPLGMLFAVLGVTVFPYMNISIFTQIGFVVLVGLASKNAILMVEFAKQLRDDGQPLLDATVDACQLRLRPIIMTSCAFILGVLPLIIAGGAGAEMRRALGVAVFCGMLGVTIFGIFFTPVFYYVIERLAEGGGKLSGAARAMCNLLCVTGLAAGIGVLLEKTSSLSLNWSLLIGLVVATVVGALIHFGHGSRRLGRVPSTREGAA